MLFITAALAKSQEPLAFLLEISNYGFRLPPALEALLALLLPGAEMLLGCLLLFGNSRAAAALSIAMLALFSIGIFAALPAGYLHRCGCLGPERLDPTLALIKNGIAMALLVFGFLPFGRRAGKTNPWGALGIVMGGTLSNPAAAGLLILCGFLSSTSGRRAFFALLIGLALGFFLKLTGFPVISLIVLGSVLYFFAVAEERQTGVWRAMACAAIITAICWVGFAYPTAPRFLRPVLGAGQSLPPSLSFSEPMAKDEKGSSLLLFLQPDCDECRDWLPMAAAMARRPGLPPLTGIVPGMAVNAEAFREKEELPFDVRAVDVFDFNRMVRRTPLLILAESGKVTRIFTEGSMPQSAALAEAMR
ncbi:MAG TPA: MauE/DoxX family redox-associated membrane protein [bacterium]